MSLAPGTHTFGPDNATLTVRTQRGGAAAKAGHDLVIEVTSWQATLELAGAPSISLTADPRSLRVREGVGGMMELGDDDKSGIERTIDQEVLKGSEIVFRSSDVRASPDGSRLDVSGELKLAGATHPIVFALAVQDGRLTGSATVKQTDWGMKPYSALFGTLKVLDGVRVGVDATLPGS